LVQPLTFYDFMRACAVTLLTLLIWKPLIMAVLVGLLLKSPRAPFLAASFPGLCDFSHLSSLPFAERCRIQLCLASAPKAKAGLALATLIAKKEPGDSSGPVSQSAAQPAHEASAAEPAAEPAEQSSAQALQSGQPEQIGPREDNKQGEPTMEVTLDVELHKKLLMHVDSLHIPSLKASLQSRGCHHKWQTSIEAIEAIEARN
jgi:hypothetical protein